LLAHTAAAVALCRPLQRLLSLQGPTFLSALTIDEDAALFHLLASNTELPTALVEQAAHAAAHSHLCVASALSTSRHAVTLCCQTPDLLRLCLCDTSAAKVVLGVGGGGESGQDHLIPALLAGNPDLCHVVARHPRLLVGAHPLVIKALMVGVTDNSYQSLQQQANIMLQMTNSSPAAAYYPHCDNPSTSCIALHVNRVLLGSMLLYVKLPFMFCEY